RISDFISETAKTHPSTEQIQAFYGVYVLERIGNNDARDLLTKLSKGAAAAEVTRQAKAALERLGKSDPQSPKDIKLEEDLWTDLARDDARQAFRAIRALTARPDDAIPFVGKQLQASRKETSDEAKLQQERALEALELIGTDAV